MKLIVELNSLELLNHDKSEIAAYLIGADGLSLRPSHIYDIRELKDIIKIIHKQGQQVIINACRIFSEFELTDLEKNLAAILTLLPDYIMYTDFAVKTILNKLCYDNLIYYAPTYLTNSLDIEMVLSDNKMAVVSPYINFTDIISICEKVDQPLVINAFGKFAIFHSRRPLLSNYFKYRGLDLNPHDNYQVVEELRSDYHNLVEDENGTHFYLEGFYYLLEELNKLPFDEYLLINTLFLDSNDTKMIVIGYLEALRGDAPAEIVKTWQKNGISLTKGLLYKKSILVKGGEANDE